MRQAAAGGNYFFGLRSSFIAKTLSASSGPMRITAWMAFPNFVFGFISIACTKSRSTHTSGGDSAPHGECVDSADLRVDCAWIARLFTRALRVDFAVFFIVGSFFINNLRRVGYLISGRKAPHTRFFSKPWPTAIASGTAEAAAKAVHTLLMKIAKWLMFPAFSFHPKSRPREGCGRPHPAFSRPTSALLRPESPTSALLRPESPTSALLRPESPTSALLRPESPTSALLRPESPTSALLRPESPTHAFFLKTMANGHRQRHRRSAEIPTLAGMQPPEMPRHFDMSIRIIYIPSLFPPHLRFAPAGKPHLRFAPAGKPHLRFAPAGKPHLRFAPAGKPHTRNRESINKG
jgi:hypothetical protein